MPQVSLTSSYCTDVGLLPSTFPFFAQADSAENVQAILFSSQTESLIMKMNWKLRKHAKHHLTKRAAQFGVEVPAAFAGFNEAKQVCACAAAATLALCAQNFPDAPPYLSIFGPSLLTPAALRLALLSHRTWASTCSRRR